LDSYGDRRILQASSQVFLRNRIAAHELGQQSGQKPVLVFGTLCPGGEQVRQLEPARRRAPLNHAAGVIANDLSSDVAAVDILANVVQEDIDRRCTAT
jgi:hypothetical protein